MASVLFVNALQVNFASVLTMEHNGMVKRFKSLKDSELKGFLEASGSVYEEAVLEFFTNAKVLAGTIVSLVGARNIAITKDTLIEVFGLPSEGLNSFLTIPKETVIEGFVSQVSALLLHLVKENLGESVKMHPQKVLTNTASNAEDEESQGFQPIKKEKTVNRKKKSTAAEPRQKKHKKRIRVRWWHVISSGSKWLNPLIKESTISFPLKNFAKRKRTQRPQTQQRSAGDGGNSQYDSIPTIPVEGEGTFAGENLETGSEEHERANRDQDAQMSNGSQFENQGFETQLDSMNPNDKESDSIQDEPERSSANSLETETNHSERAIVAHSGPGRQRLHKELKVIATVHKNHRAMAGLYIVDEEVLFLESESNQPFLLEFSSLADQEQAAAQTESQQLDHPSNETTVMISHEHPTQENEPPAQIDGHQAVGNEHQAHNEQGVNLPGSDRSLEKHPAAIVLSEGNPETVTTSERNNCDHQGPVPSNLQLAVPTPTDPSTLQFMDTTTQTLTTLYTRVSSLDLTCARINDDTNLTRHHTTLLREQLKNAVDGLDIKIDVLERTLSKRMDYSHQHLPSWKLLWFATMLIATSSWLTSWLQ
ncbi:hypothetical protein F511_09410 [Dorcoceras hygrometricum]|uniref:Uncharacterized protein n=1 Tax=Dorcoceras hygrometricum TaxID=472368 RepID=A0A2Z7BH08_9LAMI|nr:hypothetical protein F511_09410 [Dorcoceras hygrometricum]